MTNPQTVPEETTAHWPTFPLLYTFNPSNVGVPDTFDPDELVVFDPSGSDDGAWLSADRGSYVAIEDTR